MRIKVEVIGLEGGAGVGVKRVISSRIAPNSERSASTLEGSPRSVML